MSGELRDITALPCADAAVARRADPESLPPLGAAFALALLNFGRKYDRKPLYDCLNFRGSVTTASVLVEIWEETE